MDSLAPSMSPAPTSAVEHRENEINHFLRSPWVDIFVAFTVILACSIFWLAAKGRSLRAPPGNLIVYSTGFSSLYLLILVAGAHQQSCTTAVADFVTLINFNGSIYTKCFDKIISSEFCYAVSVQWLVFWHLHIWAQLFNPVRDLRHRMRYYWLGVIVCSCSMIGYKFAVLGAFEAIYENQKQFEFSPRKLKTHGIVLAILMWNFEMIELLIASTISFSLLVRARVAYSTESIRVKFLRANLMYVTWLLPTRSWLLPYSQVTRSSVTLIVVSLISIFISGYETRQLLYPKENWAKATNVLLWFKVVTVMFYASPRFPQRLPHRNERGPSRN